jgi:outer membrane lipoprotein-sorting protein
MNILRRLPLSRLLLLCGVIVAVGIGATALALAVGSGPTPPPKPLAEALHDALAGTGTEQVQGVSARIQYTNRLLEGANLASGGSGDGGAGGLASNPLLAGATGRLWIGANGHARLELQSEKGDTQILYDGDSVSLYDAATNTLYRYTPPPRSDGTETTPGQGAESGETRGSATDHKIPTVAEIEEGIAHASKHANLSGATPTDVAGQAAYTVRVSPRENGGEIGGAELSWDATNGVPLRAAVYSTSSPSPVIELAATEISYGPVESSTLDFTPPANAKVETVTLPTGHHSEADGSSSDANRPHVSIHGKGLGAIALLEGTPKADPGDIESASGKESSGSSTDGLQQVNINGVSASELPTQLGTLLSFERAGVRYVLAGSVTPSAIEEFARGL